MLSLISLAAVGSYWIDRALFPYARPDGYLVRDWRCGTCVGTHRVDYPIADGYEIPFMVSTIRRTAIAAAVILAVALAVMGQQLIRLGRHLVVLLVASALRCRRRRPTCRVQPSSTGRSSCVMPVSSGHGRTGLDARRTDPSGERLAPGAVSAVGAQGMAQFMPATSSWIAGLYPRWRRTPFQSVLRCAPS